MRHLTLLIAASCLLSACASGPPPMLARPIPVPPPPNVTAPPQPLPPPASGRMADLEANHREVARLYHQLASQTCRLLQYLQITPDECKPFMRGQEQRARPQEAEGAP